MVENSRFVSLFVSLFVSPFVSGKCGNLPCLDMPNQLLDLATTRAIMSEVARQTAQKKRAKMSKTERKTARENSEK